MRVKVTYFEDHHGRYAMRVSKAKVEDTVDVVEMTEGEFSHFQNVQASYDNMQASLKRKLEAHENVFQENVAE